MIEILVDQTSFDNMGKLIAEKSKVVAGLGHDPKSLAAILRSSQYRGADDHTRC